MNTILKYFPDLTEHQCEQLRMMESLYHEWNAKINVISRKDINNLEINHLLHSMAIAKFVSWIPGTQVLDFGTGGGLPGLPLALLYPDVQFHLVDRTGKKIKVAQDIAQQTGLHNVTVQHGDIGEVKGQWDFVVSRAVMSLKGMVPLLKRLIKKDCHNAMPNGLICLKGGDLSGEVQKFKKTVIIDNLSKYFSEPYFSTKKVVYLPLV